ncbi:MAG: hypothetical protein DDT35_00012 [Firmicutes bacterium]|nr:hypothetical protein [Bacillota bacterium]
MGTGSGQGINSFFNVRVGFAGENVLIKFFIGNAHLPLIGLPGPQSGSGGFGDDDFWDSIRSTPPSPYLVKYPTVNSLRLLVPSTRHECKLA